MKKRIGASKPQNEGGLGLQVYCGAPHVGHLLEPACIRP